MSVIISLAKYNTIGIKIAYNVLNIRIVMREINPYTFAIKYIYKKFLSI